METPAPNPSRSKLWLAIAVVVGLLALTTWDTVRNSGGGYSADLRRAAFDGDEAKVRRLIAAHPEWIDTVGSTNGQTRMLGDLYDRAMKAVGKSPSYTSLGDPEKQFQLLEGLGATPLFHAVARKHFTTAMLLLDARASVRVQLLNGWPITFAATAGGDTNLLEALERRGAKLDVQETRSGMTLLHYATFSARSEMLVFLLGRGLPINATNRFGTTPLHIAAGGGMLGHAQLLTTNGADLTYADHRGNTALALAQASPHVSAPAIVTWLEAFAATNQLPAKPVP